MFEVESTLSTQIRQIRVSTHNTSVKEEIYISAVTKSIPGSSSREKSILALAPLLWFNVIKFHVLICSNCCS